MMATHAWFQGKSHRLPLVLALAACTLIPARARLGETEPETTARYGPQVGIYAAGTAGYLYRTLTFTHAGYTIIAQFMGSTCEMICFQKTGGSAFAEDELDLLLDSEAAGQTWIRSKLVTIDLIWDRPDGTMARYDTQAHVLGFFSARYIEASDTRRSYEKKKKIESL